jgi:acetyl-CoA acetyltransferase
MDKVVATALEAVADVPDGASPAVGGFGLSGVPNVLNEAFAAQVLGCVAEWPEFDPAIFNPQGGAIGVGQGLALVLER